MIDEEFIDAEQIINYPNLCGPPQDHLPQPALLSSYPKPLEGKVTCMSFNEKATRIIVGTTRGYFVYDINRCMLLFSKVLERAVGIAELMGNTNLVILSGYVSTECSEESLVDLKNVLFRDDETDSDIENITFDDVVHKIKVRRERLYISHGSKISVFATRGLEKLLTIKSCNPPIFDISYQGDFTVVYVDESSGEKTSTGKPLENNIRVCTESLDNMRFFKKGPRIKTHENSITAIAVSPNNSLFATVSDGKNIELLRMDGTYFNVLRRSYNSAGTRAIAFSPNGSIVAMISSNGTCHVFEKSYKYSFPAISSSSLYCNFKCGNAEILAFSSDSSNIIVASKSEVTIYSVFLDSVKKCLSVKEVGSYNFCENRKNGSMFIKPN